MRSGVQGFILPLIYGEAQRKKRTPDLWHDQCVASMGTMPRWVWLLSRGTKYGDCALQHKPIGVAVVLEEWIKNVPLPLVERIVSDSRVRGSRIWELASSELRRRRELLFHAA